MKAKRFTEEQIVAVLREAEVGTGVEGSSERKMVGPQLKRQAEDLLREERELGVTRAHAPAYWSGFPGRSTLIGAGEQTPISCVNAFTSSPVRNADMDTDASSAVAAGEGWQVNRERTYRLYREAGLAVRRRKRKRIGPFERKPLPKPSAVNRS